MNNLIELKTKLKMQGERNTSNKNLFLNASKQIATNWGYIDHFVD